MNINVFDILPNIVSRFKNKTNPSNKSNVQSLHRLNDKITFVFIDDLYPERCVEIIKVYEKHGIKNIKLFTSKNVSSPYVVKIDSIISKSQYSWFVLKKLHEYIDTDYALINQWDGYIINFDKWSDQFFDYDYIGAPWWWRKDCVYGGNGGFSLRSKRLLNLTRDISYDESLPEDEVICVNNLDKLIQNGMKFATKDVSKTFSVENEVSQNSFGFHCYNTQNIKWAKSFYKQKFYHSGDLGDIIYSLPFIKAMGGGTIILSADYHGMEIRSPMTLEKSKMLNELLVSQDYIFDVQSTPNKPSDIDFDLNNFRDSFIEWGQGKYNEDQVRVLRHTKLTQLYRDRIFSKIPVNFDEERWLTFNKKIVLTDKPIVVNKTERYPRKNFPWKQLVEEYGNKMIFVGSQHEYNLFIKNYGHIDFYSTNTFLTLAQVINGSKLFIGNQSFPYSLAEGMKVNTIQETNNTVAPNCMFVRDNAYLTYNEESIKYSNIKSVIEKYV